MVRCMIKKNWIMSSSSSEEDKLERLYYLEEELRLAREEVDKLKIQMRAISRQIDTHTKEIEALMQSQSTSCHSQFPTLPHRDDA